MIYEWKDKVVLITGAATGIGAEIVKIIVGEGTRYVAVLDIAEGPGIDLQNELNAKYGEDKVKFYKCDVTDEDLLLGYFDEIHAKYGLEVVINNAGIMNDSYKTYKKQIEINVTALVTGTLKAMDLMRKDKGGKGGTIINISSIVALHQSPLLPIYFATKSAVLQFSNCIGLDDFYSRTDVRVLTICYGATDTPLLDLKNLATFDEHLQSILPERLQVYPFQLKENAAQGLVDAFKVGESGSTWLSTTNRPVKDITTTVKKAYELLTNLVFE
ncbi:hypothetical protein K1T71_003756 [Dendrolimus kikuchii]|uniref:Uncharacterized protein n=1 Tax=Dendrolimus kikuchii TaxID=765133 RepID=A0ACC1DAC2_9NEOP|nr:hypothetical protein K1T71_003756 [Dendrolimus kikuchii]